MPAFSTQPKASPSPSCATGPHLAYARDGSTIGYAFSNEDDIHGVHGYGNVACSDADCQGPLLLR